MILANVRGRLRPADFRVVTLALTRGDANRRAAYERLLADEGPDALLGALLLEFGDHDRHARVRAHDDETCRYLVDIVSDLAEGGAPDDGERAFLLLAHLGNDSLWFAGLFPACVAARRRKSGGPDLPYYAHGPRLTHRGTAWAPGSPRPRVPPPT